MILNFFNVLIGFDMISSLKFSLVQFFCLFGVKLQLDRFTIKGNNLQN